MQTMILYGNCQAEAVAAILSKNPLISGLFRIVYMRSFVHPTEGAMKLDPADLTDCAVVAEQYDPHPFPYRDALPAGCPVVTFPSVDCNVLWPFTSTNPHNHPEPPLYPFGRFPYGDRVVTACLAKGMSASETFDYYMNGWDEYKIDLDRLEQIEKARLRTRDEHCIIKMTEYVFENLRQRRLYWTSNHPTPELLRELTERILRACFNANETIEKTADIERTIVTAFGERGPLGVLGVPIHPRVAAHLKLEWYDPDEPYSYYGGRLLSYEEYFREYIETALRERDRVAAS